MPGACTIVVEKLGDQHYRATCPLFPDCQVDARTEQSARNAIQQAIERIIRERSLRTAHERD